MTEPMTDADLSNMQRRLDPNAFFQSTIVDAETVRRILARLDAERSRADAADAARDAALARVTETEDEADRWFTRALVAVGKLPKDIRIGSFQDAHREIEKLRARAIPEPVMMETVEQVKALVSGHYLIRRRGEEAAAPWRCDRSAPTPWRTVGTGHGNGDLYFIGARVSGPLPNLPIPTPTQEG